ncbi:DEAD/DEAH box helicase [Alicyclobacillus kakegawensis]|uniref:DEAD/DEAH box helicase n=1 Tax=Alicyclobacillus kakegawensis TaxID=392012 RepID=UPI000830CFC4|nr:DEAD/DEAH box helicase [Alicyclobacillus kakegawensis]
MITIQMDLKRLADGAVWLGPAELPAPLSTEELALRVFAWDPDSEYGTWVETEPCDGRVGFRLSPAHALRYFRRPHYHRHTDWRWSEACQEAFTWAPVLAQALDEGRFEPALRLQPPQSSEKDSEWASAPVAHPQAPNLTWRIRWLQDSTPPQPLRAALEAWGNAVIWEEVAAHPEVQQAWEEVLATRPLLTARKLPSWMEGEEWLAAIGWDTYVSPVQPALQLVDPPVAERPWLLRVVFKADVEPGRVWTAAEARADASFPGEWLADLEAAQQRAQRWLREDPWLLGLSWQDGIASLDVAGAWRFLTESSPRLTQAGCEVMVPAWWGLDREIRPQVRAHVKPPQGGRTWVGLAETLDFDWKVALGGAELDEQEFWRLVDRNQRLINLNGQWLVLNPDHLRRLRRRLDSMRRRGLTMMDVLQHALLEGTDGQDAAIRPDTGGSVDEADGAVRFVFPAAMQKTLHGLARVEGVPLRDVPAGFRGRLRPYQELGFRWLCWLRELGLGACLADDMGLGKTVQFIAYLLACGRQDGPALIVCPTSVLGNWQRELRQFAPGLRVCVHYGSERAHGDALAKVAGRADVIVTTYNLVHLDKEDLGRIRFGTVCLDEAQNIKNPATKQAQAVRRLQARHRIALTGTPVENRLSELWSLFAFLNPGYLGSWRSFTERFVTPIERHQDEARTHQLQRLVQPFLLRRMKTDSTIELDLPDKTETREYVHLTREQAALYQAVLDELLASMDGVPAMQRRGLILAALTRLKLICDHPAVYLKERGRRYKGRSNKFDRLLEMVEELRLEGGQCLIFTQFTEVGRMIQQVLGQRLKEPVLFLHGAVSQADREEMVAQFQDPAHLAGVFVLSLRAGGVGLNLTAASHVFHFDRWWNPAVEEQATDRAYRIGQQRHVQVHKFVSMGTLEERIDQMLLEKAALSERIVGTGEQWLTDLSDEELKELFSLRREWIGE